MALKKKTKITPRYVDHRSTVVDAIPDFTIDPDTQVVLHDMVESGRDLNCNNICNPAFWDDSWSICPLCGGEWDEDIGGFIHQGEH